MKKIMIFKQYTKRLTAYMIALIMLVSCFGASAADVYTKEDLEAFNENVRLLSAFGLVDKGREAATTISRGDFASVMLKYLGYGTGFMAGDISFSDVPDPKSPAYGMAQIGLMNGYPDGSFRPDDNILAEQAITVIVTALGYEPIAKMKGGYPTGYLECANQMDLLKKTSIKQDDILTYFNLIQILVNALTVDVVEKDNTGGYYIADKTWLGSRLDCEKRDGVVTAVGDVSLNSDDKKWEETITIDGNVYGIDGDYSYLLGSYAEFYVNSDDEIIYIAEKRTDRQELLPEDIISYEGKTYTVEIDRKKEKFRLSQDAYIVFNGVAADSISIEDMCPKYGKVTLIDNDCDNKYDIVLIDRFEIYSVQSVNQKDRLIYYKNSNGEVLDFGNFDDKDLTIVNVSGKTMVLEDIKAESVIRVAFSKDKEKAKMIVSNSTVSGSITKKSKDRIYIDNIEYKFVDEQIDLSEVIVGRGGTFYLDSEGFIAAIQSNDNSYTYAYMLNAYMSDNGEDLYMKVFNSQGNVVEMKVARKTDIDGLKKQNNEKVLSMLKRGTDSVVKQVIRFKCNGNGEIKEIDTPYNSKSDITAKPQNGESAETLRLIYSGSTHYVSQLHNFVGKINVDSETLVIVAAGDDPDDYMIKRVSEMPDKTDVRIEAYSDNENEFYAKILFSDDKMVKSGGSGGEVVGVVSDITKTINEDDEPATLISFKSKLFDKDLLIEDELVNRFPYSAAQDPEYSLDIGDIVALQILGDEASEVSLIYKPKENLFPAGSKYAGLTEARVHYIYGDVYSIEKGFMNVTQKDIAAEGAPLMTEVESYKLSDFIKIFKYTDTRNGKGIVPATAADVVDYKTAGSNCSKVFIAVEWEYPNIMVIYD